MALMTLMTFIRSCWIMLRPSHHGTPAASSAQALRHTALMALMTFIAV